MANDSAWQVSLVERARQIVAQAAGGADLAAVAPPTRARLAAMIDHTVLKPEAPPDAIDRACDEAREHRFASVCVNPCYVARCAHRLAGSGVGVCTVAGFPLGANLSRVKAFEAQQAIAQGATEVDMVIAVGALKGGDYGAVRDDIRAVTDVCHGSGAVCKVIIEAALLTDEEKALACLLIAEAGADFCKTSTGFGPGGAKAEDVRLMRAAVGPDMGVKAAGGIRTYAAAAEMVRAGATRIGASAGPQILADAPDAP